MPIAGWMAGVSKHQWISAYDHWLAFGLLGFVGGRMILEAQREKDNRDIVKDPTRGGAIVMLSAATSIDALAGGFSLALLGISIWLPALVIGVVAAVFTVAGILKGFVATG